MEYMVYPRLLALAERGWRQAPWERPFTLLRTFTNTTTAVDQGALDAEWQVFTNMLGPTLPL